MSCGTRKNDCGTRKNDCGTRKNGCKQSELLTPNGLTGYQESILILCPDIFRKVAKAASIAPENFNLELDGLKHKADLLKIDSSFFGMFDVKLVEGSMDFLIPQSKNMRKQSKKKTKFLKKKTKP
jgi:hypothetical protein